MRKEVPGKLQMWDVVQHLDKVLPPDAIITNGAGNYTVWVHRFHRYRGFRTQLAPASGAMGYGVPAAIGAKALYRNRTVVSFAGDGCFLMTGQELATAVQHQLPVVIIVVNNGMYGTIRMHQEREYPGASSRHDAGEPGFRRLRARIRCARRSGRDHGAVRAGLRARAAGGQAGAARAAAGSRSDFTECDAELDSQGRPEKAERKA